MKKNEFYRESTPGSRIKKGIRRAARIVDPLNIYGKVGEKIRTGVKSTDVVESYKKMAKKSYNVGRNIGKKINKAIGNEDGLINRFKKVSSQAMTTGFNKKPGAFKLRSGNKPSIAKLSGIEDATKGAISGGLKRDPKNPFYVIPKGPEVKDNMPNQKPDRKSLEGGMGLKAFEDFLERQKIDQNRKPPGKINMLPKTKPMGKMNITRDIKKRK